jgi:hypothetical protein
MNENKKPQTSAEECPVIVGQAAPLRTDGMGSVTQAMKAKRGIAMRLPGLRGRNIR